MIDLTLRYLHELLGCPVLFFQDEDSLVNNQERVCGQIRAGFRQSLRQALRHPDPLHRLSPMN